MLFRPTSPFELETVAALTVDDEVGWVGAERYRREYAVRHFRPEWSWVAEDNNEIVARALWWGRADSEHPLALDCLHVQRSVPDRAGLAAELLTTGRAQLRCPGLTTEPQYSIALSDGWRGQPAVATAVAWRSQAAHRAGLSEQVERLRYEWTPGADVPAFATRLVFGPDPDDEAFLAAFPRIAVDSLDIATLRALPVLGADRQAREDLEFYLSCPGKREWWRLAHTPDGDLAGVAIPSATPYSRNVGYLGVVPELRGRGYIDEVLGQITRLHARTAPT